MNMNTKKTDQFENLLEMDSSREVLSGFLQKQLLEWPLASSNYIGLERVEEREILFDGFVVKIQFNPERIRSSAAKVDKETISQRRCFLCMDNLPPQQEGIAWGDDYMILVNPFPILKEHFTLPRIEHVDQSFSDNVESMLRMASQMQGYTLFYNGPECGASAPDHMHFQAGRENFMPVEWEYPNIKRMQGEIVISNSNVEITAFNSYLRKMISVESSSVTEILKVVDVFYTSLAAMQPQKKEPMLNAICRFVDGNYTMHLFPRELHRPSQYFAEGEKQILISPASVDFGGVFITPRREDFEKISAEDIIDIFRQVSMDADAFDQLKENIKDNYNITN